MLVLMRNDTIATLGGTINAENDVDVHALSQIDVDSFVGAAGVTDSGISLVASVGLYSIRADFEPIFTLDPLRFLSNIDSTDSVQSFIDQQVANLTTQAGGGLTNLLNKYAQGVSGDQAAAAAIAAAAPTTPAQTAIQASLAGSGTQARIRSGNVTVGGDVTVSGEEVIEAVIDSSNTANEESEDSLFALANDRGILTTGGEAGGWIDGGATVIADGSVKVRGEVENKQEIVGATAANGTRNTVRAVIDNAMVTATADDVTVEAFSSTDAIYSALSPTQDTMLETKDSTVLIASTIDAHISGESIVTAGDDINVTADDDNTIAIAANALALKDEGYLITGSLVNNSVKNTVTAYSENSTVTANAGDVELEATSVQDVASIALGIGIQTDDGKVTAVGSVAFNDIQNTIDSHISGGQVNAGGTIRLNASDEKGDNKTRINATSGAIAGSLGDDESFTSAASGAAAINSIQNTITSSVENTDLDAGGDVSATARSSAEIEATTFGISGTLASGDKGGISLAGAGSGSGNTVANIIEASVQGGNVNANGVVSLTATDDMQITADAGGAGLAFASGKGNSTSVAIGAAAATNDVDNQVRTLLDGTSVTGTNGVSLTANSAADIEALTLAGAAGVSNSQSGSLTFGGAGAGSGNQVNNTVESIVQNGSIVDTDGTVALSATDDSKIEANAGGAALELAIGKSSAAGGGIGTAVAINEIGNTVNAKVDDSTVTAGGNVTLDATSSAEIDVFALGVAGTLAGGQGGGVAVAGAGAGAGNKVKNTVKSSVQNSSSVSAGGAVTAKATDSSKIKADAGGGSLAAAGGQEGGIGISVGAAAATNDVGNTVSAMVDSSSVEASGPLDVSAASSADIDVFTLGASGALTGGEGGGVSLVGAGSGSGNTVVNKVESSVKDSTVVVDGAVNLTATDETKITADAGAAALAIAGGQGGGVSVAIGASVSINDVDNQVRTIVDNSTIDGAASVNQSARSTSKIDSLTIAGAAGVAGGQGGGVAGSGAGAGSDNKVNNTVESLVQGGSQVTTDGTMTLSATDESEIKADAGGAAIALAGGQAGGVGVSVGAAAATNEIGNTIRASIRESAVDATGKVDVSAASSADIDVLALGVAGALSGGLGGGVALAGAGAGSGNKITNTIEALLTNSEVNSGSSVKLKAEDTASITSNSGGAAVGLSGGIGVGVSGAVGIAISSNDIANTVRSSIDTSQVDAAEKVDVLSMSDSDIDVFAVGGAFATAVSIGSFAGSAGGASATNTTRSVIESSIQGNSTVNALTGVGIDAQDTSAINSELIGFGVSVGLTGIAVGIAKTENTIENQVSAFTDKSEVNTASNNILINALGGQRSTATTTAGAASVSLGAAGAGAVSNSTINGTVEAYANDSTLSSSNGITTISANSNLTSDSEAKGGAGGVVAAAVMESHANIGGTTRAFLQGETEVNTTNFNVSADGTSTVNADGLGIGISAVGAAGVRTNATDNRIVEAYIGSQTGTTSSKPTAIKVVGGNLNVDASAKSLVDAESNVISIGLLASGAKTNTTADATPIVRAYMGDQTKVVTDQNVSFDASAQVSAQADGTGVAASAAVAIIPPETGERESGGAFVEASATPTVESFTEGSNSISANDVELTSRFNVDEAGNPVQLTDDEGRSLEPTFAKIRLGSGALLAGVAGGTVNTFNAPKLSTVVGSGTVINATGDVLLETESLQVAETDGQSIGIGGVGIGVGVIEASAVVGEDSVRKTNQIQTHFDGDLESAETLTIRSDVDAHSKVLGQADGFGAIASGTAPKVNAETAPKIATYVGETGEIKTNRDVSLESSVKTSAEAISKSITIAVGGALSDVENTATVAPIIDTFLQSNNSSGAKVASNSGNVILRSLHNVDETTGAFIADNQAFTSTDATEGAAGLRVGKINLTSNALTDVDTRVDREANITAQNGDIILESRSGNFADARAKSRGGAVINVSVANPEANANGATRAQLLGRVGDTAQQTNILGETETIGIAGARNVVVTAQSSDQSAANLDNGGGGVISVESSEARAITNPTIEARLGSNPVVADQSIEVLAGSNTDADSLAASFGVGGINVQAFTASAEATPDIDAVVESGAFVQAGDRVSIEASHGRPADAVSSGRFDASANVSTSNTDNGNSIAFSEPHGLETGDVVTYSAERNENSIGGLEDGRSYNIIARSPNLVQLGATFDGASIDPLTDIITFDTPHNLEGNPFDEAGISNDDEVIYDPAGGTPIPGLSLGRYTVFKIDDNRLKLIPVGVALPTRSFNPSTISNGEFAIANHGFSENQPVTYRTTEQPIIFDANDVGVNLVTFETDDGETYIGPEINGNGDRIHPDDANNIFIGEHNFQNGDLVIYRAPERLDGKVDGLPIPGLVNDRTYEVIRASDESIQLSEVRTDSSDPLVAISIDSEGSSGTVISGDHSFTRVPITGLIDGQTYYVRPIDGDRFGLAAQPNGNPLNLDNSNTNGTHFLRQEGSDLLGSGSGKHNLVINLTPSFASGEHKLVNTAAASSLLGTLSRDEPEESRNKLETLFGDGTVFASATGGGGGGIDVRAATSNSTSTIDVNTTISETAVLRSGRVNLSSTSVNRAEGDSSNKGKGFVTIGDSKANVIVNNNLTTTIAANSDISATKDVNIQSISSEDGRASAGTSGKGLGAGVDANSNVRLNYQNKILIDGNVSAEEQIVARSNSGVQTSNTVSTRGRGLGVNVDSNTGDGDGTRIGEAGNEARTTTIIGSNANLSASEIQLDASVNRFQGDVNSSANAGGLGADSDATARITVDDVTEVILQPQSVITGDSVQLTSSHKNIDLSANARAKTRGLGGSTDATAVVDYNSDSQVTGQDESFIKTSNLSVEVVQENIQLTQSARKDGALLDGGDVNADGVANANRTIFWETTTRMYGEQNPEILIDVNGEIKELNNVTVRSLTTDGLLSEPLQVGQIIPVGDIIVIDDIVYDEDNRFARFYANDLGPYNEEEDGDDKDNDVTPFPKSSILGNAGLFDYQETFDFVKVTNLSDRDVIINDIDVINDVDQLQDPDDRPSIEIDVDDVPNNDDLPFPSSIEFTEDRTFDFDIVQSFDPTLVEIQTVNPTDSLERTPDIFVNGTIENPVGRTRIFNNLGDIQTTNQRGVTDPDGRLALIQTNILDLQATQGSIGESNNRFNVDLVRSENRPSQAFVEADQDVYFDLMGRLRDPNLSELTINIDSINAGKELDLFLQDSVREVDVGESLGIIIDVTRENPRPNRGTFYNHFRPDIGLPPKLDVGTFGGNPTKIDSTYQFGLRNETDSLTGMPGLTSGRDTTIRHESTDTRVNLEGYTDLESRDEPGKLDVITTGNVDLTETSGELDIRQVKSNLGNIRLTTQDSLSAGEDIVMNGDAVISAPDGSVELQAGDDIKMSMGARIDANETVTFRGDHNNADPDQGSTLAIRGQITSDGIIITGESDGDIVDLREAEYSQSSTSLGKGDDTFTGGASNDEVSGGAGDDFINSNGGDDVLNGNGGDDELLGGEGDDMLSGEIGDDTLLGGDGSDILQGGVGLDFLSGQNGDDELNGGEDSDVLLGGNGADTFTISDDVDFIADFNEEVDKKNKP